MLAKLNSRAAHTIIRRGVQHVAAVQEEVTIRGRAGQKIHVSVGSCKDVTILKGAEPSSPIPLVRIIAGFVRGDVCLRRAPKAARKVELHICRLKGDLHILDRSLHPSSDPLHLSTEWLEAHVGPPSESVAKELAESAARMEELQAAADVDPKANVAQAALRHFVIHAGLDLSEEAKIFLNKVGDNVNIIPKYNDDALESITIVAHEIDEIKF